MITIDDLKAAIAECEGERNPNANTCMKLSAYYILLREKQGKPDTSGYSSAPAPSVSETVNYYSDTEFGQLVQDKPIKDVMSVMDELLCHLSAVHPKMYDGTLRKLRQI